MPGRSVGLGGGYLAVVVGIGALTFAGCGDDRPPPPNITTGNGTGASAAGGGSASGGGAGGGSAGGAAGGAGGASAEDCFDAIDNDLDQHIDCADSDCEEACASSCDNPVMLMDPASLVYGDTSGHADQQGASCTSTSGSEVVYQLTASQSGRLDVGVSSDMDVSLSVRTSCDSAASELGCVDRETVGRESLSLLVTQNQTLFVVVDGAAPAAVGAYRLDVATHPIVCGDAHVDAPGEMCDDGGTQAGDGCDASCQVESSESEPNDTPAVALPWGGPYYGSISPAGDVDVVSVVVPENGSLLAEVIDFGDGGCVGKSLDSYVEFIAPDGTTIVDSDDDGGDGYCSVNFLAGMPAGTYFVSVRAGNKADPVTFAYQLRLTVMP